MQTFRITKQLEAVCDSEGTRYGFRHLATLLRNGNQIGFYKACYYNRTWEAFTFQSVLEGLLHDAILHGRLSGYEARKFRNVCKNGGRRERSALHTVGLVAALGAVLQPDQKARNDFQVRILKAGLENKGLIMPEDWETLSEDEKSKRLTGAIAAIT